MHVLIASIGYQGELLNERDRELQAAGYDVRQGRNFVQALALLRARSFDVVVIGHTVPEHERTLLALEAKRLNASACIVYIYLTEISHAEMADAIINITSGHSDLVATIQHLLLERAREARRGA